ncbi:tuftelin isoform 4-T4 [Dugong dugon]
MNGTRNWCTLVDVYPEGQTAGSADILRLTLQSELTGEELEHIARKTGRKTYTMVSGRSAGQSLASELVESSDGHEEIIKVDSCMSEDIESLRKTVRDLLAKLQEVERQHQSDRAAFEVTLSRYQREAEESNVALQKEEDKVEHKKAEIADLQRRLSEMETEHQTLLAKVREGETALEEVRSQSADCQAEREKAASLEKEVAGLREKIHHLDDMLKSQQRKVRQMIEQLQNSKAVIQSKDTTIQELKEKVAYLEAENLEMHERMEHLIEKQISHSNFSTQTQAKTENPGRIAKPPSPKPMALIRVVET